VHLALLRQLRPSLGHSLQAEASKAEAVLGDVLTQQQLVAAQQAGQATQHGGRAIRCGRAQSLAGV
jgi:hypothetical protein